jgi:acyl-coenzyme A thioesterase PaaI-like protein
MMPAVGGGAAAIEFKINMLAPAAGDRVVARARVIRSGRTVTVCWCECDSHDGEKEKLVATHGRHHDDRRRRGLND